MNLKKLALFVFSASVLSSCAVKKETQKRFFKEAMDVVTNPMPAHRAYPEETHMKAYDDSLAITSRLQLARAVYWDMQDNKETLTEKQIDKTSKRLGKFVKIISLKAAGSRSFENKGFLGRECSNPTTGITPIGITFGCGN